MVAVGSFRAMGWWGFATILFCVIPQLVVLGEPGTLNLNVQNSSVKSIYIQSPIGGSFVQLGSNQYPVFVPLAISLSLDAKLVEDEGLGLYRLCVAVNGTSEEQPSPCSPLADAFRPDFEVRARIARPGTHWLTVQVVRGPPPPRPRPGGALCSSRPVALTTGGGGGPPFGADPYALQMALKLLAARRVRTDFYLTLDADVVATALAPGRGSLVGPDGRAVYTPEGRGVHPLWWAGSEGLLGPAGGGGGGGGAAAVGPGHPLWADGFGVTPAVLSTGGALATLALVEAALGAASSCCC